MSYSFLGSPPDYVKQWIKNKKSKIFWDTFISKLENFPQLSSSLPEVGSSLNVEYKVDPNGEAIDTEWMVLGYNSDIPRYVKYKNGDTRVYMDVLPETSNTLLTSFSGANVYSTKDGSEIGNPLGTVTTTGGSPFIYGNNNTYSVPGTITVNGTVYTFCGHNVTLQSKYGLAAKYGGNLYTRAQFRSLEKSNEYRNDWRTSEIRDWLNGTNAISTQKWKRSSGSNYTTGNIIGLLGRLPDTNFTNNIIPTVTRTWVHDDWRNGTEDSNGCQHLADKFRLLGVGEVNCYGDDTNNYFPDGGALIDDSVTPNIRGFDTSRFDDVFNETDIRYSENSRIRKYMNEDGTEGSVCAWWLRSAWSSNSISVGCVLNSGSVNNYYAYHDGGAVLPACLIG